MSISTDIINLEVQMTSNKAMSELNKLESETADLRKENERMAISRAKLKALGKEETEDYKKLSAAMDVNRKRLKENESSMAALRRTVGVTAMSMNDLKKRANELTGQLNSTSKAANPKEYARLSKELASVQTQMGRLGIAGRQTGSFLKAMKVIIPIASFAALFQILKNTGTKMTQVRSEFERYEAVLSNTLGSSKLARVEMEKIKKFASETPFEVNNLTDSFVRLTNQGFQPTLEEMRKLGDLSSSTGKDFLQLTEAIIDAQVGEFERLKEFGIKGKKEGDKVTFSFKGVTTEVNNSSEAIRAYILSLGDLNGVSGAMEKISKTLGGRISNMKDAWGNLLNLWGEKTGGAIASAIGWITKLMTKLSKVSAAKQIEDEQLAVNRLVLELTDANTQGDRRKEIVKTLQEMAPDIVKSLDAEGFATAATADALREYNKQMINKIILANKDAEMQVQQEKIASAAQDRMKSEDELSALITKRINATKDIAKAEAYRNVILDKQLTLLEKARKLQSMGLNLNEGAPTASVSSFMGLQSISTDDRTSVLQQSIIAEKAANAELEKILKERLDLYSRLDIGTPAGSGSGGKKPAAGGKPASGEDMTPHGGESIPTQPLKKISRVTGEPEMQLADGQPPVYDEAINASYDLQLMMLQDMHDRELISDKEYADKSTKIYQEMNEEKLRSYETYARAATELTDIISTFSEAAKNRELAAAGNNDKKKEAIEKKYARRQQQLAIAQTVIEGALEIARINSNAGVNADLTQTMRIILTAFAIGRTAANVALISSQKFDRGGYTPRGAWDQPQGVVHSDEFVANRHAVRNPQIRPILDVIDLAQRSGQIGSLNTDTIMRSVDARRTGYAAGGYVQPQPAAAPAVATMDIELKMILARMDATLLRLSMQIDQGIQATISYQETKKKFDEVDGIKQKVTIS